MEASNKKIVATVEARMNSSRLPGKVMMTVQGKPLLHFLVSRLKATPSLAGIVLATTTGAADDVLEDFARSEGVECYRGSELDVMGRVLQAAESADAQVIVQITGDCPLIDPDLVEQCIQIYLQNTAAYVSNAHIRSFPIGMDAAVFSLQTLRSSANQTVAALDREHVTLHIRNNPGQYPAMYIVAPPSLTWPDLPITLDQQEDYELLEKIISHFGKEIYTTNCAQIIDLLRARPSWVALNSKVHRKGDS